MKYVATFLVLFSSYILLAGLHVQELILGAFVSLILTLILAKLVNFTIDKYFPKKFIIFIFAYIPLFIWQLILSNIDVARRVLSIKIPLNPGFVKIKTDLKGDFAKLTLANSITLTPGTLTVDVEGEYLFVHTVDVKGKTAEDNKENISGKFERLLGVIFK